MNENYKWKELSDLSTKSQTKGLKNQGNYSKFKNFKIKILKNTNWLIKH